MGKFWNRFAKKLDAIGYAIVDMFAAFMEKIRPGWIRRNKARIDEWKLMIYAFNRSILGVIGLFLVIIFLFLGIFGPYLAHYRYDEYPITYLPGIARAPPGKYGFILGTDEQGRDLLSLLLYGARVSLILSLLVIIISAPIGIVLGLISGYFGGKIDEAIQRLCDIFYAFPGLVLAIALASTLTDRITDWVMKTKWVRDFLLFLFEAEPEYIGSLAPFLAVVIAIAVVGWPGYTRLVRALTLSVRENVYVEAARSLGLSSWKIMRKHILPNVFSVIIVIVTFDLAGIVIFGAAMSFLGIGLLDPFVDWGKLVYQGYRYFPESMHLVIYPGLTLFIVGLGWTLVGDTLRDVLDPTTRRRIEVMTREERIFLGDWLGLFATIALLVGLVYGAFKMSDVLIYLALVSLLIPCFAIMKLVERFTSPRSLSKVSAVVPILLYAFTLKTLNDILVAIVFMLSLVLYAISPRYKPVSE